MVAGPPWLYNPRNTIMAALTRASWSDFVPANVGCEEQNEWFFPVYT